MAIVFARRRREILHEELQITREVIRRNELAFQEGSRVMAELVETIKDMRDETRAQTRALLAVLDRLENGGEAAAG